MTEYDSLLEVRYGLSSDGEYDCLHRTFGADLIQDIKETIHNKNLVIGMDQASRKTGVCFMDYETQQVLAVVDLINLGFPSKQMYFDSIYDFFKTHISDELIKLFIYEIPVEHSKNHATLAVLEALRIFVKGFKIKIPSLTANNMVEVHNTTWKSQFLAAPKYAGRRQKRELVKEAVREEAVCRVSGLKQYFYHVAEPPDSCDAVGIAYGTLAEIYGNAPGYRRPNKTMQITNCKYESRIVAMSLEDVPNYIVANFPSYYNNNKVEILQYNPTMPYEENCKRYCSTNKGMLGIIPVYDKKASRELKWKTLKELHPGELYILFCWR